MRNPLNDFRSTNSGAHGLMQAANSAETGNHSSLRYQNLAAVLRLIYANRPISRVELSRITGLNKATVSSLVSELVDNGFVRFIGEGRSDRAGRREVLIDLEPRKASAVSVEVGVGTISTIAADFAGEVLWRSDEDFVLSDSPEKVILKAAQNAQKALMHAEATNGPVAALSFAVPGAVDGQHGTILFAPNLGWRNVPVFQKLRTRFVQPLVVENEASLAALGEHFFGAASGFNEVLYISAGIGLGGGLIVGGEIYRGASGIAGEFGHMTVDIKGKACTCGKRGCWETIANESALFEEFRRLAPKNSRFPKAPLKMIDAVLLSAVKKQTHGTAALKLIANALAVGIDSLAKSFDPELIVLGGPISSLHDLLIPMIRDELAKRTIFGLDHSVEIRPAAFGADAALNGGIAAILKSLLRSPKF